MAEFVKSYCSKCNQYYGLKIEPASKGQMQIVDFYSIPTNEAKMLSSTVDVPNLESAGNLRACYKCGSRKASGCSCAQDINECSAGMGYRFQCLYCKELRLFSKNEGAEQVDASMVGKTIELEQGQQVVISAAGAGALEQILVGVGWDVSTGSHNMDVDSSVIIKSSQSVQHELIYYGNLNSTSGCVIHRGDNLIGGKGANTVGNDSENIDIFLRKVPNYMDQLWFVLNIYQCDSRNQSLKDVRNMYIRLTDGKSKKVLLEFKVDQGMAGKTGIIIGKVFRSGSNWVFKALQNGIHVSDVQSIISYCHD